MACRRGGNVAGPRKRREAMLSYAGVLRIGLDDADGEGQRLVVRVLCEQGWVMQTETGDG